MKECCSHNAAARLTSLRVKKDLSKLMDVIHKPRESAPMNCDIVTDKNIYIESLTYSGMGTNTTF